jgi:hypothetical protein
VAFQGSPTNVIPVSTYQPPMQPPQYTMRASNNYATQAQQQYPNRGVTHQNTYVPSSKNQTGFNQNPPPFPNNMSQISNKDSKILNLSKLNNSKLNRTRM